MKKKKISCFATFFSRGHATLHLAVSVGRSVGRLVGQSVCPSRRPSVTFFEFRAVFALLLLPNRPQLDCRLSDLVYFIFSHFSNLFHSETFLATN